MFDVIIVGSGIAGGAAAQQFCEAGWKVLVLEAGRAASKPNTNPIALSESRIQAKCYAYGRNTWEYFIKDVDDPYATPPDLPFSWIRVRAIGGKSLLWAGHCYRMGDLEFKAANVDGVAEAWPLTYEEIRPYYDKAESILQVHDAVIGAAEAHLHSAFVNKGYQFIPARISDGLFEPDTGKPCIHCGEAKEECVRPVSSADSTLAAATKSGHLTLWPECRARSILTDSCGQAVGVAGIHQLTRESFEAQGRIIFLCASPLESTRILLNSTSKAFPNGMGNSSGVLGHYLMDHVSGIVVEGTCNGFSQKENSRAGMFYIPRCPNLRGKRSYGYQGFIVRADHELLPCGRTRRISDPAAEPPLPGAVQIRLAGFGEMLPHYDNHVEIDRNGKTDAEGIPSLRIHCRHGENEMAMAQDMVSTGLDLLQAAGARITEVQSAPSEPGLAIHEAGTCRMGDDARTSVLNRFNQCHEVPNLFVTDASCFPSIGAQNPVLTVMALTIRASEHAVKQFGQHKM